MFESRLSTWVIKIVCTCMLEVCIADATNVNQEVD